MKTVMILGIMSLIAVTANASDHGHAKGHAKKEVAMTKKDACKGKKGKALKACQAEQMKSEDAAHEGHDEGMSEEMSDESHDE